MKSVVCKMLGHKRSRRDARRIDACWISYCRWCGSKMIRVAPRRWSAVVYDKGVAASQAEDSATG